MYRVRLRRAWDAAKDTIRRAPRVHTDPIVHMAPAVEAVRIAADRLQPTVADLTAVHLLRMIGGLRATDGRRLRMVAGHMVALRPHTARARIAAPCRCHPMAEATVVGGLRPRPMVGVERHPMVAAEVAQVDSEAVAMSPLVEAVVIAVEAEGATAVAAVVTAAEAVADIAKGIIV